MDRMLGFAWMRDCDLATATWQLRDSYVWPAGEMRFCVSGGHGEFSIGVELRLDIEKRMAVCMLNPMGNSQSDFLYARSSFIRGMGSVFNIPGNFYAFNTRSTPQEADAAAFAKDWNVISRDLAESADKIVQRRLPELVEDPS